MHSKDQGRRTLGSKTVKNQRRWTFGDSHEHIIKDFGGIKSKRKGKTFIIMNL